MGRLGKELHFERVFKRRHQSAKPGGACRTGQGKYDPCTVGSQYLQPPRLCDSRTQRRRLCFTSSAHRPSL